MSALVIGVGQADRSDDAVGLLVAAEVRRTATAVDVVTVSSPTRLVDTWEGRNDVVVVDAIRTGRPAGAVTLVEVGNRPLPVHPGAGGSHGFGVAEAIELGRALGRLPRRLVVVGVEAASFALGAEPTPEVVAAVPAAAEAVLRALTAAADDGGVR
jgi:hydrogenase maturation protease